MKKPTIKFYVVYTATNSPIDHHELCVITGVTARAAAKTIGRKVTSHQGNHWGLGDDGLWMSGIPHVQTPEQLGTLLQNNK